MADIELVIKIPESIVKGAKSSPNYYPAYCFEKIWRAIVKGTPLPKGHGRLIDADKLYNNYVREPEEFKGGRSLMNLLREAPTIIEADKGSEDKG